MVGCMMVTEKGENICLPRIRFTNSKGKHIYHYTNIHSFDTNLFILVLKCSEGLEFRVITHHMPQLVIMQTETS